MISLNNVMRIIRRWKNSIISLRLRYLKIPHKIFWVSWGVLFKGLGVQKSTQMPCWLRPWWYEQCVITGTVHLTGYLVEDEQVNDDVWYDMNYVWLQVLFTWLATWWRMSRWMMMCDMIWTMCDYRYCSPDWLPSGGWAGEWWCVIWYEQCVITGTVHLTGYLVEDEQVNDDVWYDMNYVWLQVLFTWLATWWRMSRWMMSPC